MVSTLEINQKGKAIEVNQRPSEVKVKWGQGQSKVNSLKVTSWGEGVKKKQNKKQKRCNKRTYVEKRVRDLLLENRIPDGGHPLVHEIHNAALARNHKLLVLRRRLDPISAAQRQGSS